MDWAAIVGIDYRCPLHDDGKLVLEARHVVKLCFKTVRGRNYSRRLGTHVARCAGLVAWAQVHTPLSPFVFPPGVFPEVRLNSKLSVGKSSHGIQSQNASATRHHPCSTKNAAYLVDLGRCVGLACACASCRVLLDVNEYTALGLVSWFHLRAGGGCA